MLCILKPMAKFSGGGGGGQPKLLLLFFFFANFSKFYRDGFRQNNSQAFSNS